MFGAAHDSRHLVSEWLARACRDTADWQFGKSQGWQLPARCLVRAAAALAAEAAILPLQWLEDRLPAQQLAPAAKGTSVGPAIDGITTVEPVILPAVRLFHFTDVVVTARATAFSSADKVVVERAEVADRERCLATAGNLVWHGRHLGAVEDRRTVTVERGLFLSGFGYFNYYHWMIEILPKLRYWSALPASLREYPFLVGEEVYSQPQLAEALRYWAGGHDAVVLDDNLAYRVGSLLHISAPTMMPFNLEGGQALRITDSLTRPETVESWRDLVRRRTTARRTGGRGSRLFLARDGNRRVYNHDEVVELFEQHGFRTVQLERLSLDEQIAEMSAAELVAGPTGGSWTNLLFCSPGTRGLCWMTEQSAGFAAYSNLAALVGVDLRYVLYPSDARSTGELYTAGYHLDLDVVRRALRTLLAGS